MNARTHQTPVSDYRQQIRQALRELRQARSVDDEVGIIRAEWEMNRLLELLAPAAA
ncbi:MAG TPA: hypothetical protein VJ870_09285 [Amycolatopsis sp.]|nr:hypothetical protein [Amycolatopsis sp.]